ncbi:MAG: hypothetical protein U1A27_08705 [Phycisphaerae bacterium]
MELVVGAALAAVVTAAAFAMLYAASRASDTLGSRITVQRRGQYAVAKVVGAVRAARGLVIADTKRIVLWAADDYPAAGGNGVPGDDQTQLLEVLEISYIAGTRTLVASRISSGGLTGGLLGAAQGTVSLSTFAASTLSDYAKSLGLDTAVVSETWAEQVAGAVFSGSGRSGETRAVILDLTIGDCTLTRVFHGESVERSPGGYLSSGGTTTDGMPGVRLRSTVIPSW